jgi:predicted GNAT family acetyltransferase
MSIDFEHIEVKNNEDAKRYEVQTDNQIAELTYERHGNRLMLMHTTVPPALEGHGIAGKIAKFALEDARAQHLIVYPYCPYVASYIKRHQEYLDLVDASERKRLLE